MDEQQREANWWRDQFRMIRNLRRTRPPRVAAGLNQGRKQRRRQIDRKRKGRA
jgi:hypothetical protein